MSSIYRAITHFFLQVFHSPSHYASTFRSFPHPLSRPPSHSTFSSHSLSYSPHPVATTWLYRICTFCLHNKIITCHPIMDWMMYGRAIDESLSRALGVEPRRSGLEQTNKALDGALDSIFSRELDRDWVKYWVRHWIVHCEHYAQRRNQSA